MAKTSQFRSSAVAAALALCLLTLVAVQPAEAAFPGNNGKIAFDRTFRVWVKAPSLGAGETKLREDGLSDSQASFSPDGSRVAFVRSPGEIYVTNADGTGKPRRLTNNTVVDRNPVWSHDGTRIAFERGGQVWSMNADGASQTPLTAAESPTDDPKFDPAQPSYNPAWSSPLTGVPDGKIAFVHQGRLWTMNPDGSGKDELDYSCPTDNGICDSAVGAPAFSPDGTKIAFDYSGDIYWTNTAGGGDSTPILRDASGIGEYPGDEKMAAWSPDGAKIAFEHNDVGGSGSYDVYMANANGSSTRATQLTNSIGDEFNPDWQPLPQCTKKVNANNDPLTGTAARDVLCGDNRNNTINGASGNDIILAGGGNDRLTGGPGNDTLNGGPGMDTTLYPGSTRVIANLNTGFASGVGMDALLGVESLTGSSAGDSLVGSAAANTIVGGKGADTLSGLGGADKLHSKDGVNGNDTLNGGGGTDNCIRDATEASIISCP